MRVGATIDSARSTNWHPRGTSRARLTFLSILAMLAGLLAAAGGAAPAQAVQAPGHDVAAWSNGWSWTYATSFRYQADGTDVTINENVTYTVTNTETFNGHDAYRLNISGSITGGSGSVDTGSVGTATLSSFSGNVSGTRFVRRSDLALLRETQHQHLNADAKVGFITQGITADINLELTPSPSWKTHNFPLNPGDNWQLNEQIVYTGGFSYDAGSLGGSGSDTFNGTLPFQAPANVASTTVSVPIGNVASDLISASSADGQTVDNHWWSPTHKNDARQVLILPLDGAKLTLTRNLSGASIPAAGTGITETVTPSLTCAGGQVTVAGTLSSAASGVPVSIKLDQSQINPGQAVTTSTTTGAGGNYSTTLTVPAHNEGLSKNGSRANWGVLVSAGGATNVATVVVTPQNCTTLTYTGATSAPQTGTATVSAQLTDLTGAGAGGRQVSFALSGGATVSATTDAAGVATTTVPVNGPVRNATIVTSYAGSANFAPAGDSDGFAVTTIPTTTSVVPSASPVTIGDPVSFTATVAPGLGSAAPGGSVQFKIDDIDFGAVVPLNGAGVATSAPITTLTLGNHVVTAVYGGNADFGASTSVGVSFLVRNPLLVTTTTQTVAPGNSVFGQPVTLASTVTTAGGGTPTGTVTWSEGGTPVATASLDGSGQASVAVSDLAVGSHTIVAAYGGDEVYNVSAAAPRNTNVLKATVSVEVSSSDTTTVSGEAVSFTANVGVTAPGGGTPNGSVQLVIDGNNVGAPVNLVGGLATFPAVTSLINGSHSVAAVYSGSGNYTGATDTLTQEVTKADTVTSVIATPSPSNEGQNIAITANVAALAPGSGSPTGTILFTANGDTIGAAALQSGPGGSQATVNVPDLAPGSYSIVASYPGDPGYTASESAPVSQTVIAGSAIVPTATSVTSSENPSTYGSLITFTAQVEAEDGTNPAGAVQFSVDGANFGSPVPVNAQGVAESAALASPDPGDHTVIATFVADPGFSGSGDIITQTVAAAGVDLDVSSSDASSTYGQGVSFSAAVSSQQVGTGTPTGFVQFVVDGQPLGDAVELTGGQATSPTVSNLAPGDHNVSVVYSGDIHFLTALESITQSVAKVGTATTLAVSAASTTFGQAVTLTATVDPALNTLGSPGGSVSFVDGSTTLGTVPVSAAAGSNATASLTVSDLDAGAHTIKAVYSGSESFTASTSATKTVTVGKRATSIKAEAAVVKLLPLGLPLGQLKITLTSANGPVGGVPVVFKVGTTTVCTATTYSTGEAYCSASHLLIQLVLFNGYKATFAGNANYLTSTAQGVVLK